MRRLGVLGAAVGAIAFATGACGSDDNDGNGGSAASANEPPVYNGTGATGAGGTTIPAGATGNGGSGQGAAQTPDPATVLSEWTESYFDACRAELQVPEPYKVILMFVVDVSGSMTQQAPGTTMTKWDATRQALSQVVDTLPASAAMGIVYYPNLDPPPLQHTEPTDDLSECVNTGALVDPQPMEGTHKAMLQNSLLNVVVAGGTPTHSAYTVGLQSLEAAGQRLPGNRYMLLITDGEPTYGVGCVGDGTVRLSNMDPAYIEDTLDAVGAAYALSPPISTFVIGSPGSELNYSNTDARPWLSNASVLGHTSPLGCSSTGSPFYCHFDLSDPNTNFASGLTNALAQILGQVVACGYSPPAAPAGEKLDPSLVDIKFIAGDKREFRVPPANEADCGISNHGWYWTQQGSIALCPATCNLVHADSLSGIEVAYGCARQLT